MLRVGAAINGFRMLVIQDKKLVHYVMAKNKSNKSKTHLLIYTKTWR
jgi:hypothetical protein